jgi:hypothetical protein
MDGVELQIFHGLRGRARGNGSAAYRALSQQFAQNTSAEICHPVASSGWPKSKVAIQNGRRQSYSPQKGTRVDIS